jgi:hypothetical protein
MSDALAGLDFDRASFETRSASAPQDEDFLNATKEQPSSWERQRRVSKDAVTSMQRAV